MIDTFTIPMHKLEPGDFVPAWDAYIVSAEVQK